MHVRIKLQIKRIRAKRQKKKKKKLCLKNTIFITYTSEIKFKKNSCSSYFAKHFFRKSSYHDMIHHTIHGHQDNVYIKSVLEKLHIYNVVKENNSKYVLNIYGQILKIINALSILFR